MGECQNCTGRACKCGCHAGQKKSVLGVERLSDSVVITLSPSKTKELVLLLDTVDSCDELYLALIDKGIFPKD